MKIKEIYWTTDPTRNIIQKPDGSLYSVIATPYRPLSDKDLTPIDSPLSAEMYLRYAHAETYTPAFRNLVMTNYRLEDAENG